MTHYTRKQRKGSEARQKNQEFSQIWVPTAHEVWGGASSQRTDCN